MGSEEFDTYSISCPNPSLGLYNSVRPIRLTSDICPDDVLISEVEYHAPVGLPLLLLNSTKDLRSIAGFGVSHDLT